MQPELQHHYSTRSRRKVFEDLNISVLIGLLGACLGFSVALIVHVWELLKYLRKATSREREEASLQLQ